ncbi:MAG: DUF433 domain-containing protein [Bacteroidota bacterium]
MIEWQNHIVTDDKVLVGKPVIKGTRLSVEFIFERLASGWSEKEVLDNYPRLKQDDIKAVHAFTYECFKDGLRYRR